MTFVTYILSPMWYTACDLGWMECIRRKDVDERVLPAIDLEICTECGLCVDQCPTRAVEMSDVGWPVIVRPEDCAYCGLCEEMCPEGAIALSYEIVVLPDPSDTSP